MASAASLYQDLEPKSIYYDKRSGNNIWCWHYLGLTQEQYKDKLKNSTTLYVGNLSFYTNES